MVNQPASDDMENMADNNAVTSPDHEDGNSLERARRIFKQFAQSKQPEKRDSLKQRGVVSFNNNQHRTKAEGFKDSRRKFNVMKMVVSETSKYHQIWKLI